ncbi:MAG: sulfotransferase [Acidimicrobiales bacterium]
MGAPLLAEAAPDARLLVILRDPVERFRSGVAHLWRGGADHVGRTQAEARPKPGRSLYADSLRRWRRFIPERLLVLQYEACVADTATQLARTHEFLGLDPSFRPPPPQGRLNRTHEAKIELSADVLERFDELMGPDLDALVDLVPDLDLSLWATAVRHAARSS